MTTVHVVTTREYVRYPDLQMLIEVKNPSDEEDSFCFTERGRVCGILTHKNSLNRTIILKQKKKKRNKKIFKTCFE